MKTSEVLNKAADLIEERGWAKGDGWPDARRPEDAPLCLEGGILAALGRNHMGPAIESCPAYAAVWDFLATDVRWGPYRDRLYDWNDNLGRTASEVIEVLRAAALIEASRERETAEVPA